MKDKDKWTSRLIYRKNLKWNWDGGKKKSEQNQWTEEQLQAS